MSNPEPDLTFLNHRTMDVEYNSGYNRPAAGASADAFDLSMFESPDLSKFTPGPFLYTFDKQNKCGRAFPFDPTQVVFAPPERRGNNNSSIVRLQYRNPLTGMLENLQLQTPKMATIFGLSTIDKLDGVNSRPSAYGGGWKLDLSFRDLLQLRYNPDTSNEDLRALQCLFHTFFILDQMALKKAKESVATWFAGSRQLERNPALVDGLYKPLSATRFSKKKQRYYPPALRVKAGRTHGNFNFKVYSGNEFTEVVVGGRSLQAPKALQAQDIQPDTQLVCVLEVTGIWFVENNFGIGLRLLQAQVFKPEVMDTFCIASLTPIPDENDDDQGQNQSQSQPQEDPFRLVGMK